MCDYTPIRRLQLMVWLGGQGLRKNMMGKLMTKRSMNRPL